MREKMLLIANRLGARATEFRKRAAIADSQNKSRKAERYYIVNLVLTVIAKEIEDELK
jgi:hypothetical protein